MQQLDFYNTIGLRGDELTRARAQCKSQEARILAFFRQRPHVPFSPEEALLALTPGTPLTSARRAITNLTLAGKLAKTGLQMPGRFGKPMHLWRLALPQDPETEVLQQ